jgi:hypothetical protein
MYNEDDVIAYLLDNYEKATLQYNPIFGYKEVRLEAKHFGMIFEFVDCDILFIRDTYNLETGRKIQEDNIAYSYLEVVGLAEVVNPYFYL